MKRIIKNFLSYIIVCMAICIIPVLSQTGEAAVYDSYTYRINEGDTISILDYPTSKAGVNGVLEIPNEISGIPVVSIEDGAFEGCKKIQSVKIPANVNYIGTRAFNAEGLLEIMVSDMNSNYCAISGVLFSKDTTTLVQYPIGREDITYEIPPHVSTIGKFAFANGENLTEITVPGTVKIIDEGTFSECVNLLTIGFEDGLESINSEAFSGCTSLTDVYYTGTEEEWAEITIEESNECLTNATIHYNTLDSKFATVEVNDVIGLCGEEVTVPVSITNNQGIAGFKFRINYDKTVLTPVDIVINEDLGGSITSNIHEEGVDVSQLDYVTAVWSNESDYTENGELFSIKFKIANYALADTETVIELSCEDRNITNSTLDDIYVDILPGRVNIVNLIYGDIYKDGAVNSKDIVRLRQYLALWDIELLEYELKAADVYKDGVTDNKDLVRLSQYIAEWDVKLGE